MPSGVSPSPTSSAMIGAKRRVDARDLVVPVATDDVVARIHDRAPRKGDVGASERLAVVPADVMPQVVDDRALVGRYPAVRVCRHHRREHRHEITVLIERR
jgi:hypothetical protein